VYAELALLSRRPAADMAEATGVSAASVHRWVAEARRRGHLPRAGEARLVASIQRRARNGKAGC
jgi:transposase-like protein